jgi:Serine/threonine protein kinase
MGAVYRAWDARLEVPVAVKEMVPQPGLDPPTLAHLRGQFRQEALTLARLNHPHLVRVTDFFEEGGNAYLVMDLVQGQSLADLIAARGPLPEDQVLEWDPPTAGRAGPIATARGSSTGTLSLRTSSSARTGRPCWWTLDW